MAAGKLVQVYKAPIPKGKKNLTISKSEKNIAKIAQKVVDKNSEPKQAFTSVNNVLFNSGVDSVGDLQQILPSIAQGSGEGQRTGNRITAKKLNIRGYIKMNFQDVPDSTKLSNVGVRLMVLSMKVTPSFQDAQTLSSKIGTLLLKGNTTSAFSGTIPDLFAPINTGVFTVHYNKVFYLKQDFINTIGASAPSTTISQDISKTIKFFNINVKCKNRKLLYDNNVGSDILPVNFGPFLCLGYTYLDGSSSDVLNTNVALSYDSIFTYTDL